MDQKLIQAAVNAFCIVPEVYQQAFQQMGVEFPDELVQAIKTKPEDAVKMVQNDKELFKGVVTIYQQYGDEINQAAQAAQQTGVFAKGGKLNYLLEKNIVYAQDGAKIRRRDAMQMAMGAGLSRSQARTALTNANNAVGRGGAEMVYKSFKDKQMNAAQPAQPERRVLSMPASTPQVTVQTPTLATPGNLDDFEAQRAARKNAALEGVYNNIMAGNWWNGHDVRAQRAAEAVFTPPVQETTPVETKPEVSPIKKGKRYTDKQDFVKDMTEAYTEALASRGISTDYAKMLVAQDALESNWGKSSLAEAFNFGGVKAKGGVPFVEKETNEYDSKEGMHKTRAKFRKFNSLEDYANYKVDLLSGKRYQAFTGDTSRFYHRIEAGGYATDPNYISKLMNVYNSQVFSAKQGGSMPSKIDMLVAKFNEQFNK